MNDSKTIVREAYTIYLDNLLRGATPGEAAQRARILPDCIADFIRDAETDPTFIEMRAAAVEKLDPQKAWTANTAIVHLLRLVENPTEKGNVKLGAIDRLNVLLGIVMVDKDGNTRAGGMTLDDLFRLKAQGAASATTKH